MFNAALCHGASPDLKDYCKSIRNWTLAMAACFIEDEGDYANFLEAKDASYLREACPPIICLDRLQECPTCSDASKDCPPGINNQNVADMTDTINASIILTFKRVGFSSIIL